MAKRWTCPRCGGGKLAPERPRKNDTRRYCLPCSDKTGRLVERTCKALEKRREAVQERSKAKARRKTKAKRKRQAASVERIQSARRQRLLALGITRTLDFEFKRICRLKCWRGLGLGRLKLRWEMGSGDRVSGHANWIAKEVFVTLPDPDNLAGDIWDKRSEVIEVLIHEAAHHATDSLYPHSGAHGEEFKRELIRATAEASGREVLASIDAPTWKVDKACVAAIVAAHREMIEANRREEDGEDEAERL
jgi:hypothetical protein